MFNICRIRVQYETDATGFDFKLNSTRSKTEAHLENLNLTRPETRKLPVEPESGLGLAQPADITGRIPTSNDIIPHFQWSEFGEMTTLFESLSTKRAGGNFLLLAHLSSRCNMPIAFEGVPYTIYMLHSDNTLTVVLIFHRVPTNPAGDCFSSSFSSSHKQLSVSSFTFSPLIDFKKS